MNKFSEIVRLVLGNVGRKRMLRSGDKSHMNCFWLQRADIIGVIRSAGRNGLTISIQRLKRATGPYKKIISCWQRLRHILVTGRRFFNRWEGKGLSIWSKIATSLSTITIRNKQTKRVKKGYWSRLWRSSKEKWKRPRLDVC